MIYGKLHTQISWNGRRITIDACRMYGKYEIMVMYSSNGREIECKYADTLEEATAIYNDMVDRYTVKEPQIKPLTGKYLKLKEDIAECLKVAEKAAEGVEDTGSCNLDAASVNLPRWRQALVEQAVKEAGAGCFVWNVVGGKRYVIHTPPVGQAKCNQVAAEAMTEEFQKRRYDAFTYYQMD